MNLGITKSWILHLLPFADYYTKFCGAEKMLEKKILCDLNDQLYNTELLISLELD